MTNTQKSEVVFSQMYQKVLDEAPTETHFPRNPIEMAKLVKSKYTITPASLREAVDRAGAMDICGAYLILCKSIVHHLSESKSVEEADNRITSVLALFKREGAHVGKMSKGIRGRLTETNTEVVQMEVLGSLASFYMVRLMFGEQAGISQQYQGMSDAVERTVDDFMRLVALKSTGLEEHISVMSQMLRKGLMLVPAALAKQPHNVVARKRLAAALIRVMDENNIEALKDIETKSPGFFKSIADDIPLLWGLVMIALNSGDLPYASVVPLWEMMDHDGILVAQVPDDEAEKIIDKVRVFSEIAETLSDVLDEVGADSHKVIGVLSARVKGVDCDGDCEHCDEKDEHGIPKWAQSGPDRIM